MKAWQTLVNCFKGPWPNFSEWNLMLWKLEQAPILNPCFVFLIQEVKKVGAELGLEPFIVQGESLQEKGFGGNIVGSNVYLFYKKRCQEKGLEVILFAVMFICVIKKVLPKWVKKWTGQGWWRNNNILRQLVCGAITCKILQSLCTTYAMSLCIKFVWCFTITLPNVSLCSPCKSLLDCTIATDLLYPQSTTIGRGYVKAPSMIV